jgi:hypothetical protein
MSSTDLEIMRWNLATSPVVVVYVLGIIVAVKRYRRHPRISTLALFALVGLLLLLLLSVLMPFVYRFVPDYLSTLDLDILNLTHSLVYAALFLLLLVAVFSGRSQHVGIRGADGQYLPPDFLARQGQK